MGELTFDARKAMYDGDRDIVRFWAADGEKRVPCGVTHEALADYTRSVVGGRDASVALYRTHAAKVHDVAQRKYRAGQLEPDGGILVMSADLA